MITVKAKILTLIECYVDDGEDDAGNPTFIGENSVGIMIMEPNDFSGVEKRIVFKFGLLREGSGWIFEPTEWYPVNSYIRFRVSRKDLKKYYRLNISSIKDIDSVQN